MTREEAIKDLFLLFCGKAPPTGLLTSSTHSLRELDEVTYERLQDFVNMNLHTQWLTGISVLEVIDTLVAEAVANDERGFNETPAYGTSPSERAIEAGEKWLNQPRNTKKSASDLMAWLRKKNTR